MQTKTDAIKPKNFPYTFYLMDDKQEKAYEEPIFSNYRGPIYWNDCGRDFIVDPNQPKENFQPENMAKLIYSSLTPLKIYEGGEKPLTAKLICDGVARVGFIPGEHCFLENIQIQVSLSECFYVLILFDLFAFYNISLITNPTFYRLILKCCHKSFNYDQ